MSDSRGNDTKRRRAPVFGLRVKTNPPLALISGEREAMSRAIFLCQAHRDSAALGEDWARIVDCPR